MPGTRKDATDIALDIPPIQIRSADLADYTVTFETHREDMDPAPLFTGLPDNRCQCPHWGYVTAGAITFHYAEHDETFSAGDAYYAPPGHTPEIHAGSEVVEFSPTVELAKTSAVLEANMAAMEGAPS